MVWSKPEKGGKPFAAKILATHQRSDQPIYRLKLKSVRADGKAEGETLLVTPGHPFYVPAKRDFIPVIDLKPGDLLQSLADGDTDNTSSEVESLELYLPVGQTFNLTVDVGHTFYVGDLKTWVHNTGPCFLPEGYFGGATPSKTAVQELEVDALKSLKAREVVGDRLEHDHIPSIAALRTSKEAELGRPLTDAEYRVLYQNSTAVEVPREVHIAGRTYGGKNTPAQIQQDAADLCGAVCRDTEKLRINLSIRGYDSKLVDETIQKIVERNRKTGVIK